MGNLINPNAEVQIGKNQSKYALYSKFLHGVSLVKNTLGLLESFSLEDPILRAADWCLITRTK
jgi:hypothetical protein